MSMEIGSIGSMSQVSLAKLHQEMFKRLDQNGDGKIGKTEFSTVGKNRDSSRAEELFAKIDTDQDGSISEAESDAFLTKMDQEREARRNQMPWGDPSMLAAASAAELRKKIFASLDQNGDGKIGKTEFSTVGKNRDSSRAEELFAKIDTDQDGSISEAESDAFLTKMEEARKSGETPSAPPPGQDWQASKLTAMLANASQGGQGSEGSMSLYV